MVQQPLKTWNCLHQEHVAEAVERLQKSESCPYGFY